MQYTITLNAEEEKALLSDMIDIQVWVDNALHEKARRCMDRVILKHSNKQPDKLSQEERLQIVRDADVKTAAETEEELLNKQ